MSWSLLTEILQDLRFAIRGVQKQPGFAIAAILIVAIGIAVNTTVFSIFNSVLLRPLPYREADRIAIVWEKRAKEGTRTNGVTPADYLDWRAQNHVFASLTAHDEAPFTMTGSGEPERLIAVLASTDMIATYGVQPLLGRGFLASDEKDGGRVMLLGYGFWQRHFGGAKSVLGRVVRLDGQPYTIAGVMPRKFRMYFGREPDVYMPLVLAGERRRDRSAHDLLVIGRLRPGVSIEEAQADLIAISTRLEKEWPAFNAGHSANVVDITSQLRDTVRPIMLVLVSAVALVLLIACANVANLLLAQGFTRRRELAIREALGAGRARLVRLLLCESTLLSVCGGAIGVTLAAAVIRFIKPLLPKLSAGGWIPGIDSVGIDVRVLFFAFVLSLLAAIVFGIVPALHLSRTDVHSGLKESGRSFSPSRTSIRIRDLLVVAEAGLSCILLAGATLLLTTFIRLAQVNPGFQPDRRVSFEITVPSDLRKPEKQTVLCRSIVEKISALPGVRSAALTNYVPGFTTGWRWGLRTEEHPEMRSIEDFLKIWMKVVSGDFISTMGIPVLQGRSLTDGDSEHSAPVVLLSETAARRYFPGEDAIGKRIAFGDQALWRTVVGVVGSVKHLGLNRDPEPEIYVPISQLDMPFDEIWLVVHFAGQSGPIVQAVRHALLGMNSSLAVGRVETIDQLLAESTSPQRFNAVLIVSFAAIALLLASGGVYSVIAFLVMQQTREIGVRMALGATRTEIIALFMLRSSRPIIVGVIIGAIGALLLNRLLRSFLFGISPNALIAYLVPAICLIAAGLLATLLPARRAAKIDPIAALRHE